MENKITQFIHDETERAVLDGNVPDVEVQVEYALTMMSVDELGTFAEMIDECAEIQEKHPNVK